MDKSAKLLSLFIIVAAVFAAIPAFAAEGRTPIWRAGTVITTDGKYFLSRDLVSPPGTGPAIIVTGGALNVDIDLNGFTVYGDPAGAFPGVVMAVDPMETFTLRNGTISHIGGPGNCIHAGPPAGVGLETTHVTVEDVKTIGGDIGIAIESTKTSAVRRNQVRGSAASGISIVGFGVGGPITGAVENNIVSESGVFGIHLEANHSGFTVSHNRVDVSGSNGIYIVGGDGFLVAQNTIEDAADNGLHVEAANNSKLWNNVIHRSGANGMFLAGLGGFLVLDNTSSGNGADGIFADNFISLIDRNVLNANGGCGLHFGPGSTDNSFGRNQAKFNAGATCVCGAPVPPSIICTPPAGGAGFLAFPDFCNEGIPAPGPGANDSMCDNHMPGPGQS